MDRGIRTTASRMAASGPAFPPLTSLPAKGIVGFTDAERGGRAKLSGIMVGRIDGADRGAADSRCLRTTILAVAGLSGMLAEKGRSGMVVGRDGRLGLGAEGR
jgi:hypothetical protein